MALRRVPIYRTGQRPITIMGGDREIVMFGGLISFALAFAAMTWLAFWSALFIWTFTLFATRRMAKADPLMRFVFVRQLNYRKYYSPRASPFRSNTAGQIARYR